MKTTLRAASLAGLVLALAASAHAQRTTGTISGTVKDTSGAVLPGATVSVSGPNIVGHADRGDQRARLLPLPQPAAGRVPALVCPHGLQDASPGAASG